jgi:hypothetical protein
MAVFKYVADILLSRVIECYQMHLFQHKNIDILEMSAPARQMASQKIGANRTGLR